MSPTRRVIKQPKQQTENTIITIISDVSVERLNTDLPVEVFEFDVFDINESNASDDSSSL